MEDKPLSAEQHAAKERFEKLKRKAEAKAKAKEEAEARGQEYIDPDEVIIEPKKAFKFKPFLKIGLLLLVIALIVWGFYGLFKGGAPTAVAGFFVANKKSLFIAALVLLYLFFLNKVVRKKKRKLFKILGLTAVFAAIIWLLAGGMSSKASSNDSADATREKSVADSLSLADQVKTKLDSAARIKAGTEMLLAEIAKLKADSVNQAQLQHGIIAADDSNCIAKDSYNAAYAEYMRLKNAQKLAASNVNHCTTKLKVSLDGVGTATATSADGNATIIVKQK